LDVLRTEYTQPAALAKAFLCLLACQEPCYLTNGEPVPLDEAIASANRSDRHHVFPKALLNSNGFLHRQGYSEIESGSLSKSRASSGRATMARVAAATLG